MYTKKISVFVILSLSIVTVAMAATDLSLVSPVFAGGDKCKDNGDDSCNDKHETQKIKSWNDCKGEIEFKNSDDSTAALSVNCQHDGNANLKDVDQTNSTIFGGINASPF